ncbi:restriction endonuclease [Roseomonas xinghualingensis]|uniref:restriction endonuclease n=1 Tax=Roseomonas xinghualingensis TaxID=2986475 RepID=UPI0021F192A8|nr:restriction endonuclease [Roseomonas sp. SXEYE001]MCV4205900.1 restriction endonuclease [Roseomonas sp. SXEYE001]
MGVLLAALALLAFAAVLVIAHGIPVEAPPPAKPGKAAEAPSLTPRQFEQHCADVLAARGWSVTVGRGSGDQGVDVLARKGGRSVVLQCKLYSRPVGNKAVQEALAGCGYAGADGAAVVSNAAFTAAAHALAARTGVLLLHVSDLPRADTLFQFPANPAPLPAEPPTRARRRRARQPARTAGWRLPGPAIPAMVLAGFILLCPRMAPETPDAPPPGASRQALPLPPPAPPAPFRQASR